MATKAKNTAHAEAQRVIHDLINEHKNQIKSLKDEIADMKLALVGESAPPCTCDQQSTDPMCPAKLMGYRVGRGMTCSIPPGRRS